MNILFMTLSRVWDISAHGIYADLLRRFGQSGDSVYILTPLERRFGGKTDILEQDHCQIVRLKTLNQQKTNFLEKGTGMLLIESQYRSAIRKYFKDVKFDLILYSTPPITLESPIKYVKKRDGAFSYLLLKDIFPQNSVDIQLLSTKGIRGLIYSYFRRKEKKLYEISDKIGCMSAANVRYLLEHNSYISPEKVEVCPNSLEITDIRMTADEKAAIRIKNDIPADKTVFLYGGNLGKPQCIPFLIELIDACHRPDVFFLIVGDGTDYPLIEDYIHRKNPTNLRLMKRIPREDYDILSASADVGMILLDSRFTIPNFPSRLLGYMQAGLPVLAFTDTSTDIPQVIQDGDFGWWAESRDSTLAVAMIDTVCSSDLAEKGRHSREYLLSHYSINESYNIVNKSFNEWKYNENSSNQKN